MDGEWIAPGYRHVQVLGSGASGRVVRAEHLATGRQVAIKYLSDRLVRDQEFLGRFRGEARLLADLDDPNLVRFHEYVESLLGAAIVMELVDGVSLAAMLESEGPTQPEAALAVLKGSLLGLAAAHAAGVVHRDYKPGNVLVRADGMSKLADFGVAVRQGTAVPAAGTPAYMAPEQWSGNPVGPASDVYAATAVFYECLTGQRPYVARTIPQLALAHSRGNIPAGNVPEPLRDLVVHGLAKNPQDRPQSARAFLRELEAMAFASYGIDWEGRGRHQLKERAALLALLFPLSRPTEMDATGIALTELGGGSGGPGGPGRPGGPRGRRGNIRLIVTAAALGVLLLGGGTALVAATSGSSTPLAKSTAKPSVEPSTDTSEPPGETPTADPSSSPTPSDSPTDSPAPTPSFAPSASVSPAPTGGAGSGTSTPTAAPTTTKPAVKPTKPSSPKPTPFQVTGVSVSVSRAVGSRTGSFTVQLSTTGTPAQSVPVTISVGPSGMVQSDSPSSITLSAPGYSATYSLTGDCGKADTPWSWTVTASGGGKSGSGSTSGPYYPQDRFCG